MSETKYRTTCTRCGYERDYVAGAGMDGCPVCVGNPPQRVTEIKPNGREVK